MKPVSLATHFAALLSGAVLARCLWTPTIPLAHETQASPEHQRFGREEPRRIHSPKQAAAVENNDTPPNANSVSPVQSVVPTEWPDNFGSLTKKALTAWAASDPRAAISWLFADDKRSERLENSFPFERRAAIREIFASLPLSELSAAFAALRDRDDGALTSEAVAALLRREPRVLDPVTVLTNLSSYASSQESIKHVHDAVLSTWARTDTAAARTWTLQMPDRDSRDAALLVVGEAMLSDDPASAIVWIEKHISQPLRSSALEYMVDVWSAADRNATASWLQSRIGDQAMDEAIAMFALKISDQDREASLRWAGQIQQRLLRDETLKSIGDQTATGK